MCEFESMTPLDGLSESCRVSFLRGRPSYQLKVIACQFEEGAQVSPVTDVNL